MTGDYVRICPVCGGEHPPATSQCGSCGALLVGVDLSLRVPAPVAAAVPPAVAAAAIVCPHADCGARNPPGSERCLYCGRPMRVEPPPAAGLYQLPAPLRDRFEIERVLPAGGAEAELMLLKGRKSGVRVMAKLYRPGIVPKGEVLERVEKVAHAHVVHLLAHGFADGIAYEVMEHCAGGSLRDLMAGGALPDGRVRAILAEVAEALAALHECRVIHRDLKPENVLVRRAEPLDLVLTDFGIASLHDATQLFTGAARTAKYAAPEAMSGVLDAAADYWSLGLMLVEMLRGAHPFAGLSDPVIAHRLATASIDLGDLPPAWRPLCRGLLQRDPARRWGIAEIRRWLAGDASLPEPEESAAALAHPYRLEGEECRSAPELAAALSRHWQAGAKDLARGQFQAWVRDELKDHDLVRFLQDLKETGGSADLHLFRLIRRLAPSIPPVWQGGSLAPESLLAAAGRAARQDREAADWLDSLFTEHVLAALPAEAWPDQAALDTRWQEAWREFTGCWRQADEALGAWRHGLMARGEAVVDYDALVFGHGGGLRRPAAGLAHGPLLAALERQDYRSELRARVLAEAAAHLEHSPWLEGFCRRAEGDDTAALAALVTVLHLLPQARRASEEGHQRVAARREEQVDRLTQLHGRVNELLAALHGGADSLRLFFAGASRERLATRIDEFLALSAEARSLPGTGDHRGEAALRAVARAEPLVLGMRDRLADWEGASRINALWRNHQLLNGAGGFLVLVLIWRPQWLPWLLGAPALFAAWRVWIVSHHRGAIRRLAAGLPLRVSAAP